MTYYITINKEKLMEYYLNSLYGSLVYADTDSIKIKENEMKNYITVDTTYIDEVRRGIIFKCHIIGVFNSNGKAEIVLKCGEHVKCDNDYIEIIKQLV